MLGGDHPSTLNSKSNLAGLRTKQGKYGDAAALLEQALVEGNPNIRYTHYFLSCLAAAQSRRGDALEHLRQAVDLGWTRDILKDTDLDSLRGDPEFDALVERARQNAADQQAK